MYVGWLDFQFCCFVNVLSVYLMLLIFSLQSLIDDKDEVGILLVFSLGLGEKFLEFFIVDVYIEEIWLEIYGQIEVFEFFLEYVNVFSSGSELLFMIDDKEIVILVVVLRRWKNL